MAAPLLPCRCSSPRGSAPGRLLEASSTVLWRWLADLGGCGRIDGLRGFGSAARSGEFGMGWQPSLSACPLRRVWAGWQPPFLVLVLGVLVFGLFCGSVAVAGCLIWPAAGSGSLALCWQRGGWLLRGGDAVIPQEVCGPVAVRVGSALSSVAWGCAVKSTPSESLPGSCRPAVAAPTGVVSLLEGAVVEFLRHASFSDLVLWAKA